MAGIQANGGFEGGDGFCRLPDFVPGQRELVGILGIAGIQSSGGLQFRDGLGVAVENGQRDGQFVTDERRVGVPLDRLLKMFECLLRLIAGKSVGAFLHLAARLVGLELEGMQQLAARLGRRINGRTQGPRRRDADVAHGIFKPLPDGFGQARSVIREEWFQRVHTFGANQRVGIGQAPQEPCTDPGLMRPRFQQPRCHRPPVRNLLRGQQPEQSIARGGVAVARGRDHLGAAAARAVHFRAVPLLDPCNGPVRVLVLMAAVAGVGHAVLFGQKRIRDGEAVVVPPVALHVSGLRHVAVHALTAGFF